MKNKIDKELWREILSKSNECSCNPNVEQHRINKDYKFVSKRDQDRLLVDMCGNPVKINLLDLRKIFENYHRSKEKKFKVEIRWSLLEKIAHYYQFPVAVFLGNKKVFDKRAKTRQEDILRKNTEFEKKVKGLVEDYYG